MSGVPSFCACDGESQEPLRVLWIWHAAVVAEYRKPLDVLGRCPDLDLTLITPRRWPERAGQMVHAEEGEGSRRGLYTHIAARTLFTGFYYVYFYPSLLFHLLRLRPDIIYCYEEAHTFIGAAVLLIRRLFLPRTRVLLYAAQNIKKRYPIPFRLFERYSFRSTDAILACGIRVGETLRAKGYRRPLKVIGLPTDTSTFAPNPTLRAQKREELGISPEAVAIGYAGKLVEEKGLSTLMSAFTEIAREHTGAHLVLAGGGTLHDTLQREAKAAGLENRVHFLGVVHNSELPALMNSLDIFVLPSETRPNWREQFGRVLVEAMACGVTSVGSDSGEIPNVLGGAGLVFPEGSPGALADCLRTLINSSTTRARYGEEGRRRAVRLFSTEKVAAQHYAVYNSMRGEE
jgi:glycosyltransferase involved in cell wall biosynthesis